MSLYREQCVLMKATVCVVCVSVLVIVVVLCVSDAETR